MVVKNLKKALLILVGCLAFMAPNMYAADGIAINSSNISSYRTISTAGTYYLAEDITFSSSSDYGIKITAEVTFDLNGHVLNGAGKVQHVIHVEKGTLTLIDSNQGTSHDGYMSDNKWCLGSSSGQTNVPISGGVITGGKANGTGGGGVYVNNNSVFTMNGGTIAGNETIGTSDGAGIRIQATSAVVMNEGAIFGNKAKHSGGGVYLASTNTCRFTMNAGSISNNYAGVNGSGGGGGIFTDNANHIIQIAGGSITNNSSSKNGGGIGVNASTTLSITGGTINNNSGSQDVYFNGNSKLELGSATIGTLYLAASKSIVKAGLWQAENLPQTTFANMSNGTIAVETGSSDVEYNDFLAFATHVAGIPSTLKLSYVAGNTGNSIIFATTDMTAGDVRIRRSGSILEGSYPCISEALAFAQNQDEIVLFSDTQEPLTVCITKNITLVTDGTPRAAKALCSTSLVNIGATGILTLKDGVTLDADDKDKKRGVECNVIVIENDGTFNMEGGKLTGGYLVQNFGGGAIRSLGGNCSITISGGEITENSSVYDGGAIRCQTSGQLTMTGGKIYNNESKECGGGIAVKASDDQYFVTFIMTGGEIYGNTAGEHGGGVHATGEFYMSGGSIHDNIVTGDGFDGGGVYLGRMSVISGGSIINNKSEKGEGGGVFVPSGDGVRSIRITGGTITGNIMKSGKDNDVYNCSSNFSIASHPEIGIIGLEGKGIIGKDSEFGFGGQQDVEIADVSMGRQVVVSKGAVVLASDKDKFNIISTLPTGSGLKFNDVTGSLDILSTENEDVTVTFHANGGTGTDYTQTINYGVSTALMSCGFSHTSQGFRCWNTNAGGTGTNYANQEMVTLTGNLELYAQWGNIDYVYFDLAAGNVTINSTSYTGYIYATTSGETVKQTVTGDPSGKHFYIYQSTENNQSTTGLVNGVMTVPTYSSVIGYGDGIDIKNTTAVEDVITAWRTNAAAVGRTATMNHIDITSSGLYDIVLDNVWSNQQEYQTGATPLSSVNINGLDWTNSHVTFRLKGENRMAKIQYLSNSDSNMMTFTSANGTGSEEGVLIVVSAETDDEVKPENPSASWRNKNYWNSAIGGSNKNKHAKGIVVDGGTIFAGTTPRDYCVAIGGGSNGCGGVTVNGGYVNAVSYTTAIGGGAGETSIGGDANIVINGGTVKAYNLGVKSPEQNEFVPCAAIGGGSSARAGGNAISYIKINGGTIYAESHGGVGIGGGSSMDRNGGPASVIINGGNITAKSLAFGDEMPACAGIGGGTGGNGGNGGDAILYISGGTVHTGSIGGGVTTNANGAIGAATVYVSGDPEINAQFLMQFGSTSRCTFNMSNGTIKGSDTGDTDFIHLQENGGALWMNDSEGEVRISGGSIEDCKAANGGAVYMIGGEFNMTSGTISNNTANADGGGVYLVGGNFTSQNCLFESNTADNNGGAIFVGQTEGNDEELEVNINDGTSITNNQANNGGGIYIDEGVSIIVKNCTVQYNTCDENGGGIFMKGEMTVEGNSLTIKDNTNGSINNNVYLPSSDNYIILGENSTPDNFELGFTAADEAPVPVLRSYDETPTHINKLTTLYAKIRSGESHIKDDAAINHVFRTPVAIEDFETNFIYLIKAWNAPVAETTIDPTKLENINTPELLAQYMVYVNGLNGQTAHPSQAGTLTADIDMSGYYWVPIGTGVDGNVFSGTFNGNGHTVKGLKCISYDQYSDLGLFGKTSNAQIHDVFVVVESITSIDDNCSLGLVNANMNGGKIENCEGSGNITASGTGCTMGGLVGTASNSASVINSMAMAEMKGGTTMGGLVGKMTSGSVENSFANPKFSNAISYTGGIVGENAGTVSNCYARLRGDAPSSFGYLVGYNNGSSVSKSYYPVGGTAIYSGTGTDLDTYTATAAYTYGNLGGNVLSDGTTYLLDKLNANAASASGYASWIRTSGSAINGDYPILKLGYESACSADGIVLQYGSLDQSLTRLTSGDVLLYGNASCTKSKPTGVNLYIDEDASLVSSSNALDAYVGVTLKSPEGKWYWHQFSTPLAEPSIGIAYSDPTTQYGPWVDPSPISFTADGYIPVGTDPANVDFYCFFEPQYHWINFKRNSNSHWHQDDGYAQITYDNETVMPKGKGYLLALAATSFVQSHGTLNNGGVSINVTASGAHLTGYNLLGNPYQSYLDFDKFAEANDGILSSGKYANSYLIFDEAENAYLTYTAGTSKGAATASRYIHPHQGFYIQASGNGTATFANGMRSAAPEGGSSYRDGGMDYPLVNLFVADAQGKRDVLVVELDRPEQSGARKMAELKHGEGNLYVSSDGNDYSILFAKGHVTEQPVRFHADSEGVFTLTWDTQNADFSYLHLIDNLAGTDTDCLACDAYRFTASTGDYDSRFRLVMQYEATGYAVEEHDGAAAASFAYISDGELVISNEGRASLQVIDMAGRIVSSLQVEGDCRISTEGMTAGVYVLSLNGMTQKIVVR